MQVGQLLHGVVRNVTPFGGFVDVGLKEDGLIHISELSEQVRPVLSPTCVCRVVALILLHGCIDACN